MICKFFEFLLNISLVSQMQLSLLNRIPRTLFMLIFFRYCFEVVLSFLERGRVRYTELMINEVLGW